MNAIRRTSWIAAAAAALFMGAGTAQAVLVNVNFEAFTPTAAASLPFENEAGLSGPAGGLGTQWNQIQDDDSNGTLVDSTGAATTISFTTTFSEGRRGANANVLPIYNSTLTDFGRGIQNRNLTINGLVSGNLYDVWIVAYRDMAPDNPLTTTATEERLSATWSTTNATTSLSSRLLDSRETQSDLVFTEGVTYLLFANVQADALGTIVFDIDATIDPVNNNKTARSGLSGFQIQAVAPPAVPEPASIALCLAGVAVIAVRRRRTV